MLKACIPILGLYFGELIDINITKSFTDESESEWSGQNTDQYSRGFEVKPKVLYLHCGSMKMDGNIIACI